MPNWSLKAFLFPIYFLLYTEINDFENKLDVLSNQVNSARNQYHAVHYKIKTLNIIVCKVFKKTILFNSNDK